jgi:predicted nuclease of predicted toxin-antitoxin system
MRVLFDRATPVPLRRRLKNHNIRTAAQQGWDRLRNGELLKAAEEDGFEVLVTTDKNMRYQQNLTSRRIAIVVLGQGNWPLIEPHTQRVAVAVNAATPGSFAEVDIPLGPLIPLVEQTGRWLIARRLAQRSIRTTWFCFGCPRLTWLPLWLASASQVLEKHSKKTLRP